MTSYRVKLAIVGAEPAVERTIGLPKGSNLGDLSRAILAVLGWGDHRAHLFIVPSKGVTVQDGRAVEDEGILNEEDASVWSYRVPMTYVYGFHPRWEVAVTFLKRSNDDLEHPVLLESEGDAPLEDCAGIEAWNSILRILADSDHPDHDDVKAWVDEVRGLEESDPKKVDDRLSGLERPSEDDDPLPTIRDPEMKAHKWRTETDTKVLSFLAQTEKADSRRISRMEVSCPRCGASCIPSLDRDGDPVSIGGKAHYPARIECGCGAVTELDLLNDGYVVDYHYYRSAHPYRMYARHDAIVRELRTELNPLRRARLLLDLARERYHLDEYDNFLDILHEAIRLSEGRDRRTSSSARVDLMYHTGQPVFGTVWFQSLDPVSSALYAVRAMGHGEKDPMEEYGRVVASLNGPETPEWLLRRIQLKALAGVEQNGRHADAARLRIEIVRELIEEAKAPGADTEVFRELCTAVSDLCADCHRNGMIETAGDTIGLYYRSFDPESKPPSPFLIVDSRVRMGLYRLTVRKDRKGAKKDLAEAFKVAKKNPGPLALQRGAVAAALLNSLGDDGDYTNFVMFVTTTLLGNHMTELKDGTEVLMLMNALADRVDEEPENPFNRGVPGFGLFGYPEDDDGFFGGNLLHGRFRRPDDAWDIGFMTRT